MIGEAIRKNHEKVTRKFVLRFFDKPKYADVLPVSTLHRIVDVYSAVVGFLLSIAFFVALLTVFFKYVLPNIGFEKTVVLLLVVNIFVVRSALEKKER